jgi:hypothetical protein
MNWCFIKHSWEYKEEMITYRMQSIGIYTNKLKSITMPTKVRLCNKCYKKQRTKGIDWVDWELTLDEERDLKLKELGI